MKGRILLNWNKGGSLVLELNNIYQGDNVELLSQVNSGIIDLTITSPPMIL